MNHSRHVQGIKVSFILILTGLMVGFLVVSAYVRASSLTNALSPEYIGDKLLTINYRMEYALTTGASLLDMIKRLAGVGNEAQAESAASTIPVLVYHGITDSANRGDRDVTTAEFKDEMFALKAAGYQTVTMDDLYRWKQGSIELPAKSFVLTFDDGRSDSYYGADPVLKALDYHATMFVISKWGLREQGGYYLSLGELAAMQQSGTWEIQAHARNAHEETYPIGPNGEQGTFFGNKLWLPAENRLETNAEFTARITSELAGVKSDLQSAFDIPDVFAYAFPFSDFGQNQTNFPGASSILIKESSSIYKLLFYQNKPGIYFSETANDPAHAGDSSFFVRRIEPVAGSTVNWLISKLAAADQKPLPYADDFSSNKGWIPVWGTFGLKPGALSFAAASNAQGAGAILDGSEGWTDYQATATVQSPTETSVFLWARFQDGDDNAGCNFGKGFVHVEQDLGGIDKIIQGNDHTGPIPAGDFTAGVRVEGRTIECLLNGQVVASSLYLDPSLDMGGFGVKTWDSRNGAAQIVVKKLDVEPINP